MCNIKLLNYMSQNNATTATFDGACLSWMKSTICFSLLSNQISLCTHSTIWFLVIGVLYFVGALWGTRILCYAGIYLHYAGDKFTEQWKGDKSCKVCSGNSCNRHKPTAHSTQVKVPKDFDNALQHVTRLALITPRISLIT